MLVLILSHILAFLSRQMKGVNMGRRAKGEGSLYKTIQKQKRPKFATTGECMIQKKVIRANVKEGFLQED